MAENKLYKFKGYMLSELNTFDELKQAIFYLERKFKWSKKHSNKLLNYLEESNDSINIFGFSLLDKKKNIKGVTLIKYQGEINISGRKIKILNLNSLFISSSARGLPAIFMIKKILQILKSSIITEVTANPKAHKLLTSLGFRSFENFNSYLNIIKSFNRFLRVKFFTKSIISKDIPYKGNFDNIKIGDSKLMEIKFNNKKILVLYNQDFVEKKVLNFYISMPIIRIIWTTNDSFFNKYQENLCIHLALKKRVLLIKSHCNINFNRSQLYKRTHLYFSDEVLNLESLAVGSELSMNFY